MPDRVLVGDAQRPRLLGGGQVEPGAVGLLLGLAKGALQKVVQRRLVVAQDGGADEDSRGRIHRGLRRHERLGLGQREPQLLQGCRHAQGRYGLGGARVVSGNGLGGQNGLIGKEGNGPGGLVGRGAVGLGIEGGRVVDEGARVADGRGVGARGDGHVRPELFGPFLGVGRSSLGVLGRVGHHARVFRQGIFHLVHFALDLGDSARIVGVAALDGLVDPEVEEVGIVEQPLVGEDLLELLGGVQGAPGRGRVGHPVRDRGYHEGLDRQAGQSEGPAEQQKVANEAAEHAPAQDAGLLAFKRHGRCRRARRAACSRRPKRFR